MAEYKINMPKINNFVSIFTINTYTLIWGGGIFMIKTINISRNKAKKSYYKVLKDINQDLNKYYILEWEDYYKMSVPPH